MTFGTKDSPHPYPFLFGRLFSNRIPVDAKLQWRKISLASKCHCCPDSPNTESLQHLFIQGIGASSIWNEFDSWFGGLGEPLLFQDSIPERMEKWAKRIQQHSKLYLCRLLPYLILWFLWSERNKCRHNELKFRAYNVVWQVHMHIRKLMEIRVIGPKQWKGVALPFPVPEQPHLNRNRLDLVVSIKWDPPNQPWLKLNTHGLFNASTDQASGGGIVRNHSGSLVSAFSTPLAASSLLEAEFLAIRKGILLARESGEYTWVESCSSHCSFKLG